MTEQPGLIARSNIQPSVFVTLDASTNFGCNASNAGDLPIGISQEGTHDPPGVAGATAFAATAGIPLKVYTVGDVCLLTAASAWSAGDRLMPTGAGPGQGTKANSGSYYGAIALEQANAGELRRVKVEQGKL